MPVPNELTPEDEALFAEHGVPSAGPGGEPINEDAAEDTPEPQSAEPATPSAQPRGEDGRFVAQPQASSSPEAPTGGDSPASSDPAPPPGFVPHAALHQERLERQRIAAQFAQLQARTNALLSQGRPETLDLPDLEADPVGYVRTLGENLRQMHEQRSQEAQLTRLDAAFEEDEAMFTSYTPDYNNAAEHYAISRATELSQFHTREQIQQIMHDEVRDIARAAWQRGVPAAQMIYQMAQARGYRPGNGAPAPAAPSNGNGGAPTPAATVAAARNNQQASRSLSHASGTNAAGQLNAEALLSMSDEEFEAYLKLGQKGANARFAAIG